MRTTRLRRARLDISLESLKIRKRQYCGAWAGRLECPLKLHKIPPSDLALKEHHSLFCDVGTG